MRSKYILPLLLLMCSSFVFATPQPQTQLNSTDFQLKNKQKKMLMFYADSPIMRLGDGFFTNNNMSAGESALDLSKSKINYSGIQSSIYLTQTVDHNELARMLNIDVSPSGGWGLFSSSASAAFLRHTENNQFTENFSYMERYYVNALLDISNLPANPTALTSIANELYAKGGCKQFTNRYGDSFITELPLGAILVSNIQLNFATAHDKQKFDATINGKIDSIFNVVTKIENAIHKSNIKGYVEISAHQIGGNPESLPDIFKTSKDGYYLTTCSLESLKDCRNVINGIIKYAQVDFKKQLTPVGLGLKLDNRLAVVGEPFLTTYTSKFNLLPAPKPDSTILKNRLELASIYNEIQNNKIFFDHFVSSAAAAYFSKDAALLIQKIQTDLDWNLNIVKRLGALCYVAGDDNVCAESLAAIKSNSKKIDTESIDYYMNTGFMQISPNCNYIPVGTPRDENQTFANYCYGQWIKGLFIFKLSNDKSVLEINGDYITPRGDHMQSYSKLTPYNSDILYTGTANFQKLGTRCKFAQPISIKFTRNNV